MQQYNTIKWILLFILFSIAIGSSIVSINAGESFNSFLLNFGTEMLGAAITYFIFDLLINQKEQRYNLRSNSIKELHSQNGFTRKTAFVDIIPTRLLSNSTIENSNFDGVILRGEKINKVKFYYISFLGINFSTSKFNKIIFFENNLGGSNLINTSFIQCKFTASNLCSAFFSNSYVKNTDFTDVNFENADISKTKFIKCNFTNVIIKNTQVKNAKLIKPINLSNIDKEYLIKNGAIVEM